MNYILLGKDAEKWIGVIDEVFEGFLRKIDYDREDRVDVVFGKFDKNVLDEGFSIPRKGTSLYEIKRFYEAKGRVGLGVFQFPQNLLYYNEGRTLQNIVKFFSSLDLHFEIRFFADKIFGKAKATHTCIAVSYSDRYTQFIFNDDRALNNNEKEKILGTTPFKLTLEKIKERCYDR